VYNNAKSAHKKLKPGLVASYGLVADWPILKEKYSKIVSKLFM